MESSMSPSYAHLVKYEIPDAAKTQRTVIVVATSYAEAIRKFLNVGHDESQIISIHRHHTEPVIL